MDGSKIALFGVVAASFLAHVGAASSAPTALAATAAGCEGGDSNLTLSPGFCARIFADNIGHARHLVVAEDGTVYVNTWSGAYYGNDKPPTGGFIVALKDTQGSGKADLVERFGDTAVQGSAGGTGIALYKDGLFAEVNDRIVRFALAHGTVVPSMPAVTIVYGLPLSGDHPMHPFVIDAKGRMFIDVGSKTNSCQEKNRLPASPGVNPCRERETRGGIWVYDADMTEQKFSAAERYASGIRNGEGMSFDSAGRLYVTQHGRDELRENWPNLYAPEQGRELPAEEVVHLERGADYGWPECYFDGLQGKLVLAPEYSGDGGKAVGVCANKIPPVAFFPAHLAPNDLLIYLGTQFPEPYRGGAYIAFHGSWNRAPAPQEGYDVVFQPLRDGRPDGKYIVFADGFAGLRREPGRARFRPSGLAMGPDGSLYVSEDMHGRIWRITYSGHISESTRIAGAQAPKWQPRPGDDSPNIARLPIPAGSSRGELALGARIFSGAVSGGTCSGCHGSDAKGSSVGPNLTTGKWLWGDGSLESLRSTIASGVPEPKQTDGSMPPLGGASLSADDLAAVSAYVWALGHSRSP